MAGLQAYLPPLSHEKMFLNQPSWCVYNEMKVIVLAPVWNFKTVCTLHLKVVHLMLRTAFPAALPHINVTLSTSIQSFPHSNPQCGVFPSWAWQWSISSPSPVCSSCLSWRRTVWSMHSPFSSLLPLARCSPLPSCSSYQRFAIHTNIPLPQKHLNTSLTFLFYAGKTFWHLWPSTPSFLVSSPSCLCFVAQGFSGSNQHCGRLLCFALTTSLIIWGGGGYICVTC